MKSWLGAALRFTADFLILLAVLAAVTGLSDTLPAPSPAALPRFALRAALELFPYALAAALGLGLFAFRRLVPSLLLGFASLVLLGTAFAAGGLALRLLDLPPPPELTRAPPSGLPIEAGSLLLSVAAYSAGGNAREVLAIDYSAPYPRLAYAESAPYLSTEGSVLVGLTRFPAYPPQGAQAGGSLFPGLHPKPPLPPSGLAFPLALLEALGFVLLAAGFALPALALRWPLAGLATAFLGIAAALAANAALASPSLAALLGGGAARLGLALPGALLRAGLEGGLGLLAGLAGIGLAQRRPR